jgi:hypothetical protein
VQARSTEKKQQAVNSFLLPYKICTTEQFVLSFFLTKLAEYHCNFSGEKINCRNVSMETPCPELTITATPISFWIGYVKIVRLTFCKTKNNL